jgi:hypothetical protein
MPMRATLTLLASLLLAAPLAAQRIPLNDLGNGKYLGQFEGGLYEHGANVPPADHEAVGLGQAALVRPLDRNGGIAIPRGSGLHCAADGSVYGTFPGAVKT